MSRRTGFCGRRDSDSLCECPLPGSGPLTTPLGSGDGNKSDKRSERKVVVLNKFRKGRKFQI